MFKQDQIFTLRSFEISEVEIPRVDCILIFSILFNALQWHNQNGSTCISTYNQENIVNSLAFIASITGLKERISSKREQVLSFKSSPSDIG